MRIARTVSAALMPLWLIACVTINVYFPAAAAEKAADRFVRDVYGKPATPSQPAAPAPEKKKSDSPQSNAGGTHVLAGIVDLLIPAAQAAENIDVNTPAIRAIKASMQARNRSLRPYYASGAIGLTANGLIAIRNPGAVPLAQRNRLRQLVAAENRDRNALYPAIARANGHPEWEQRIRSIWARRWIANANKGWWYQDGGGHWHRK
jgi:uncharacterized protein YdbL (DUF1318 family)